MSRRKIKSVNELRLVAPDMSSHPWRSPALRRTLAGGLEPMAPHGAVTCVRTASPRPAPMQIIKDAAAHDALQQYLVRIIAEDVRDALQHAAASGASLEEAVQAITFGVTTIVDGTRPMRHADAPVVPVLTFGVLDEDENLTGVLSSGDTSFMHEYAVAVAKQVVHAPGIEPGA